MAVTYELWAGQPDAAGRGSVSSRPLNGLKRQKPPPLGSLGEGGSICCRFDGGQPPQEDRFRKRIVFAMAKKGPHLLGDPSSPWSLVAYSPAALLGSLGFGLSLRPTVQLGVPRQDHKPRYL